MPYVYEDPIMSGQNPFARPVPVSTGMSDMTRPMPVRPGSGQAVNTQGQSGIGPGGRPSVDYLPGVERPAVSPEDLVVRAAPSDSQILQEQLQAIDDREQIGQTITVPMDSAPVAGGSASPMFGAGGFEFIGLVAIGALIYYMARA
jgi:hypothetical protein